ncbi:Nuclease S1 [Hordeum vulgare]|nr:Nuclease S1 [Hordeum vulgare]
MAGNGGANMAGNEIRPTGRSVRDLDGDRGSNEASMAVRDGRGGCTGECGGEAMVAAGGEGAGKAARKCPSRQILLRIEAEFGSASRHVKLEVGRSFAAPRKNICGPGRDAGSDRADNLTEALLFLSHFMGDIHQPLHVGFASDKGGNTIDVHWYMRKTELHHVWDVNIIQTAEKDYYGEDARKFVDALNKSIKGAWSYKVQEWEECAKNQTACPDIYELLEMITWA